MSQATVAAKVRAHKEKHPEQYCPVPDCLWRFRDGQPCTRHGVKPDHPEATRQSERDEQIVSIAYGNVALHNPSITKAMVREAMRGMEEESNG